MKLDPSSWKTMPWKNGAGTTHEIVRWPDRDDWVVRISVADVTAPAPFSRFPGVARWLFLVAGGPVTLALPAGPIVLAETGDLAAFSGDDDVAATAVAQASRDLNFMVRGSATASLVRGPLGRPLEGRFVAAFDFATLATTIDEPRVDLGKLSAILEVP